MNLGSYGNIAFETSAKKIRTWQRLTRASSARFAEHVVAAGKPRLEFLGPGLEELTLTIRLDAQLGLDPASELAAMRAIRERGLAHILAIGGEVIGRFVLHEMSENHRRHGKNGRLLMADVVLKLKEYVNGN